MAYHLSQRLFYLQLFPAGTVVDMFANVGVCGAAAIWNGMGYEAVEPSEQLATAIPTTIANLLSDDVSELQFFNPWFKSAYCVVVLHCGFLLLCCC